MKLNETSSDVISKRLRRAHGQLGAVIRMLDEGKNCDEIVTQLSAVNKAVSRAGYSMITAGLEQCYSAKGKSNELDLKKLEKLFLSLA